MAAFAVIQSYVAPSKAKSGAQMAVGVVVWNFGTEAGHLALLAKVNGVDVRVIPDFILVEPNQGGNFIVSFIMPNQVAQMEFTAFHWDVTQWVFDNNNTLTILLDTATGQPKAVVDALLLTVPKASKGDTVGVTVKLENIGDVAGQLAPVLTVNGVVQALVPDSSWVEPLTRASFAGSFVMPDRDALVEVTAFHSVGGQWVFDHGSSFTVILETAAVMPAPAYKELNASFAGKVSFG